MLTGAELIARMRVLVFFVTIVEAIRKVMRDPAIIAGVTKFAYTLHGHHGGVTTYGGLRFGRQCPRI